MRAFFQKSGIWQTVPLRRAGSSKTRFQPRFDPYTYTQGRWLDRDKQRRDVRSLHFDFDALLDEAIKCSPGARRVTDCEKKEGGYNRVFVIHLDNQSTVIARLPTSLAGPPEMTVSSEVATLKFVKANTTVPVPKVLSWSAEPKNKIGAEYMIMDSIPGVPLNNVWNHMTASQHVACIRSIGSLCKQLCRLRFPSYGSLYLNSSAPSGALKLDDDFCIGPLCAPQHWDRGIDAWKGNQALNKHQGPWCDVQDYFSDLIARAKSSSLRSSNKVDVETHAELLNKLQQTLNILILTEIVQNTSGPVLFHPDLHTRNIFVDAEDHTKITGIIDWQSAAIEPAFVFAAETPDFAQALPDDDENRDADLAGTTEEQEAEAKIRADVDFCVQTWLVMQQTYEKLRPASRVDPTLLRILAAPSFGWADKSVVLETLLNDLATEWVQLGLPGQSIYQLSTAEEVVQRLDEYQAKRQLQDHLTRLLRCDDDGWVSNDRWEDVLSRYRREYSRFVASVVESEEGVSESKEAAIEKADRLWPYDQR